MAARPDAAKLTETLSDLEDYLPTVRFSSGLKILQASSHNHTTDGMW
jgi:hypothetical protein